MARGKHGNHRRGHAHYRWNGGQKLSSHGYVKVHVGVGHAHADPNGYAYEHVLVWWQSGGKMPAANEVIHHRNEDKTDNRLENLELKTRVEHSVHHNSGISDESVLSIREQYASGQADMPSLARAFGISVSRVSKFIRGESRRSAGGPISTDNRGKKSAGRLLDGREWSEFPKGGE